MNHSWVKHINYEREELVCKNCGVKKWNIYLGYGKNGHAALYILPNGERTSYRPECNSPIELPNHEWSVATEDQSGK